MGGNKKIYTLLLLILSISFVLSLADFVSAEKDSSKCDFTLFYSPTCPHCANEKEFLKTIEPKYPGLNVILINAVDNYEYYENFTKLHNTSSAGVPRTFVNGKVFVGFTEEDGDLRYLSSQNAYNGYQNQIEIAIAECLGQNVTKSTNLGDIIDIGKLSTNQLFAIPLILLIFWGLFFYIFRNKINKRYFFGILFLIIIASLFIFSKVISPTKIIKYAEGFSFPVFTLIIAILDGFNPCAFAVLAILLSLLVYAKSRKKMALVGGVFIITSSIMYFIFIIVLLLLRTELLGQYKGPIKIVVALIALFVGIINIKDYFFFKQGLSFTISEKHMTKIMETGRKIMNEIRDANTARGITIAIIATATLAAFVNIVELGCTLILPVEYIEILITNYGDQLTLIHYSYIALYCIIYVIPLIAILGSFLYTFKSERMTEERGRILKLIGGLIMVALGLILLFRPEMLVFG